MEQENLKTHTAQTEVKQNIFTQVTPLSKYLAIALFILLPFIGGWIGYTYAPERVVEVESNVMEEVVNESGGLLGDPVTLITVKTFAQEHNYAKEKYYEFDNGLYIVSFVHSRYVKIDDDYSNPDDWTKTYHVSFFKNTNDGREKLFTYRVVSEDYCYLSWCEKNPSATVNLHGKEWEVLGSYNYCDAGHCGGSAYLYRRVHDGFIEYISTDLDLVNAIQEEEDISTFMSSLSFTIKSGGEQLPAQNSGLDEINNVSVNIPQDNSETKESNSPIKITLPVNDAEWEMGGSYLIRWTDDLNVSEDGKYHAHLFTETGERIPISVGKWGDKELYYTVNNLMSTPPGTYTLRVCDHPVCEEGAISHGVTVRIVDQNTSDATITLVYPKGEESWKRGDARVIQWTDSRNVPDESAYTVYVSDKNGQEYGALSHTIIGTSFHWSNVGILQNGSELPPLRAGEVAYYIKVVDKANSNNHSLINSPLATFVLTD